MCGECPARPGHAPQGQRKTPPGGKESARPGPAPIAVPAPAHIIRRLRLFSRKKAASPLTRGEMSVSAFRRASLGKRDHAARALIREGAQLPLPGASHLTRGQSPAPGALLLPHRVQPGEPSLISGHSASRVSPAAWALRRASLRGSPRPISGQVSPPERKSIPAGPGRAGGGSGASPLKSAARPAPRIPRHPLPASGVTLDFLTCREHCPPARSALTVRTPGPGGPAAPQSPPSLPLRASHVTGLRPRRDLRDSHSHRAMSRRREHASETGESAARGGAGENAQGQDFPGAAPGRSGGKRRDARIRKSARSPGALSAGAGNGQREDAPWDSPAAAGLPLEFPGR